MKIESQVTSIEISKRLKELGVKQESLFVWVKGFPNRLEMRDTDDSKKWSDIRMFSAFTVAELGEMLPIDFWTQKVQEGGWKTKEIFSRHNSIAPMYFEETEADARGKLLIYILENKLLPQGKLK